MPYESLFVDQREALALVTLDRPARLNGLDDGMVGSQDVEEGNRALRENRPARFTAR